MMRDKTKLDVMSEALQPLAVDGHDFAVDAMLRLLEAEDPEREATKIADEVVDAMINNPHDDTSTPAASDHPTAPAARSMHPSARRRHGFDDIVAAYDPSWIEAGLRKAELYANQGESWS